MIKADARLSIQRLPLDCLQVKEVQTRYPARLLHYVDLMRMHPGEYAGFLSVVPSDTHPGMFAVLDGHHRFAASIMAGRSDALCVVIEEDAKRVDHTPEHCAVCGKRLFSDFVASGESAPPAEWNALFCYGACKEHT